MLTEPLRDLLGGMQSFANEVEHPVKLRCPEHDHVIATEATIPEWTDDGLAAYVCDSCHRAHIFRWGPPKPVYVRDADTYVR